MKSYRKLLIVLIILISLLLAITYFVSKYKIEAILNAEEFCKIFNLNCGNKPLTNFLSENINPVVTPFNFKEHATGDIHVSFRGDDRNIGFIISHKTKEIEVYYNLGLKNKLKEKYGTVSEENPHGLVNWPTPLPLERAQEIINTIGAKLRIPSDMVLDRMVYKEGDGVWNAYFIRKKDGYRYKDDKIAISVIAATGDFVGYTKTYQGTACPTEVKIKEEKVVELGWEKLHRHVSKDLQKKLKEIYKAKAELFIVQDKGFFFTESRLAWVVNYIFTGGMENEIKYKPYYEYSDEEWEVVSVLMKEQLKRWSEMGQPPLLFEIEVDAATGKELYVTSVMPSWFKRFTN